jgi:hypothetical protein
MTQNAAGHSASTNTPRRITWTEDRIRGLGATTTLLTAASILGFGRTLAYELVNAGKFPVPVIRVGSRFVVPVQPLLNLLHLDQPAAGTNTLGGLDAGGGSSVDSLTTPADSPRRAPVADPEHPGGDV